MPHMVRQKIRPADRGFSLIELMMVVALLSIVLGAVFSQINNVQRNYRVQETKVDAIQEGREFIDQMTRDLHQAGYPSQEMYGSGVLMSPAANDSKNAVGLVKVSNSELWFEGDLDSSGVQSVHYALYDSSGSQVTSSSTCPCSLRRSAVLKVNATAPLSQRLPVRRR